MPIGAGRRPRLPRCCLRRDGVGGWLLVVSVVSMAWRLPASPFSRESRRRGAPLGPLARASRAGSSAPGGAAPCVRGVPRCCGASRGVRPAQEEYAQGEYGDEISWFSDSGLVEKVQNRQGLFMYFKRCLAASAFVLRRTAALAAGRFGRVDGVVAVRGTRVRRAQAPRVPRQVPAARQDLRVRERRRPQVDDHDPVDFRTHERKTKTHSEKYTSSYVGGGGGKRLRRLLGVGLGRGRGPRRHRRHAQRQVEGRAAHGRIEIPISKGRPTARPAYERPVQPRHLRLGGAVPQLPGMVHAPHKAATRGGH